MLIKTLGLDVGDMCLIENLKKKKIVNSLPYLNPEAEA